VLKEEKKPRVAELQPKENELMVARADQNDKGSSRMKIYKEKKRKGERSTWDEGDGFGEENRGGRGGEPYARAKKIKTAKYKGGDEFANTETRDGTRL